MSHDVHKIRFPECVPQSHLIPKVSPENRDQVDAYEISRQLFLKYMVADAELQLNVRHGTRVDLEKIFVAGREYCVLFGILCEMALLDVSGDTMTHEEICKIFDDAFDEMIVLLHGTAHRFLVETSMTARTLGIDL